MDIERKKKKHWVSGKVPTKDTSSKRGSGLRIDSPIGQRTPGLKGWVKNRGEV